jgi:hypothetical protein
MGGRAFLDVARVLAGRDRIVARHERSGLVDCLVEAKFEPASSDRRLTSCSLRFG